MAPRRADRLKGTLYPVDLSLRIVDVLGAKAPPDALLFRRDYLDEWPSAGAGVSMPTIRSWTARTRCRQS